jgi:hypothetical protein
MFHKKCISLVKNCKCPLCRKKYKSDNIIDLKIKYPSYTTQSEENKKKWDWHEVKEKFDKEIEDLTTKLEVSKKEAN